MAKKTIEGPFEVMNIASYGMPKAYEVVLIVDEKRNYSSLIPRKIYNEDQRQSAYGLCARLNRRWQVDHAMDEPECE